MLCEWCGPGNHKDANCPRQKGVNILDIQEPENEILAITRMQARKLAYPHATTEKERFHEARKDIQDNMTAEGKARTDKLTTNGRHRIL